MVKVSIVGIGRVGGQLVSYLLHNPKIDKIVLIDKIKSLVDGLYLDLSHAYPEFYHKLKKGEYSDTKDSKIVVITAGIPTYGEKSRMDLLNTNKEIIKEVIQNLQLSDNTILIVVSNPSDIMAYLAFKLSKLKPSQVIGFGNILDTERLRFILSQKTNVDVRNIQALVIGEHGENMIPVFSYCKIDGKSVLDFNLNLENFVEEIKTAYKEVVKLTGGTQFGPAKNIEKLINAILNDSHQILSVASFIEKNDFYQIENVCLSLPCRIGFSGISKIEEIDLNEDERSKLKFLAELLKQKEVASL